MVNVTTFGLAQSDHIKRLLLYSVIKNQLQDKFKEGNLQTFWKFFNHNSEFKVNSILTLQTKQDLFTSGFLTMIAGNKMMLTVV